MRNSRCLTQRSQPGVRAPSLCGPPQLLCASAACRSLRPEDVLRRQRALEQERLKFLYQKLPGQQHSALGRLVTEHMCAYARARRGWQGSMGSA